MKTKLWIVILSAVFTIFIFHHALRAEDALPAASNAFLDEGDADFEMPKLEAEKSTEVDADSKISAKKKKKKDAKTPRVPAAQLDDDDKSATGTKGDAFDQMQNPEAAQAPLHEKKVPTKASKKSEDLSQAQNLKGKIAATNEVVTPEVVTPAAIEIKMKPKSKSKRQTASVQFSQGFKSTNGGECIMYADPDKSSPQILVVKGAKKLWVEQKGEWFKAFHKSGSGFLSADCFQ